MIKNLLKIVEFKLQR